VDAEITTSGYLSILRLKGWFYTSDPVLLDEDVGSLFAPLVCRIIYIYKNKLTLHISQTAERNIKRVLTQTLFLLRNSGAVI
jgi:hypothetical protein